MDLHHAGVVRRVARRSLCGWRAGTRREGGAVPAEEGAPRPSQPQLWQFFFRVAKLKRNPKEKEKLLILPMSFPGSHRRARPRPKAPPLAWGGFLLRALRLRSGRAAPRHRHCGIVPACPPARTDPAGRLSSFIASEAAGGVRAAPRGPLRGWGPVVARRGHPGLCYRYAARERAGC